MTKDKQIEEMEKIIGSREEVAVWSPFKTDEQLAEELYTAGYRKASDVAREIFEEIENAHEECIHIDTSTNIGYLLQSKFEHKLAELKKKYITEEGK